MERWRERERERVEEGKRQHITNMERVERKFLFF
jgi:hypothetical protein